MSKTKKATLNKSKVWINGISGRMGQGIAKILEDHEKLSFFAGSDHTTTKAGWQLLSSCDLVIDFSTPSGNKTLLEALKKQTQKKVLVGTTGLSKEQLNAWKKVAKDCKHSVLIAANTSLGVHTLASHVGAFAKTLTAADWDIVIIETHHNRKQDAPSGTALLLLRMIQKTCPDHKMSLGHEGPRSSKSIGMHAVRGGGVFGEHEVRFIGEHEEVYVGHRAFSRALFAEGAVRLGAKLLSSKFKDAVALEDWDGA